MKKTKALLAGVSVLAMFLPGISVDADGGGQTQIKPGMNFFTIEQDIQLGRQAASEVERKYRLVNDPVVQEWVDELGRRLASHTTMPNLPWRFRVVDTKAVNAFALPGGFVYVNRGLIEMTDDESEVAGVVGHEMAHVTLRHGTHQLSKSLMARFPLAALGGFGGAAGAIGQLGSIGASFAFLKFSRDDERQADIVGVQTMAKSGYDSHGMITIFQRLDKMGSGRGTPQFLSDHPNPENRIQKIEKEISLLPSSTRIQASSTLYAQARNRLKSASYTSDGDYRNGGGSTRGGRSRNPSRDDDGHRPRQSRGDSRDSREPRDDSRPETRPETREELPSRELQSYRASDGHFQVDFPTNWSAYPQTGSSVTLAPEWALDGTDVTRGVIVSIFEPKSGNRTRLSLDRALDLIVTQVSQSSNYLREAQGARYREYLAGAEARATFLTRRSSTGETERVWIVARPYNKGIVYLAMIAPEREFKTYEPAFQAVVKSLRMDQRQ